MIRTGPQLAVVRDPLLGQTALPSGYLRHCTFLCVVSLFSKSWARMGSIMGVSCQAGDLRCRVCHVSHWYKHKPCIVVQEGGGIEEKQAQGGKKTQERGLFTTGEAGWGREGWEDRDRLHANLQKRPQKERLPEKRKTNTQRQRNRKSEWMMAEKKRQQPWVMAALPEGTHLHSFYFCLSSPRVRFVWELHKLLPGQI